MSVVKPKDRIARFARAALKQALGVVTGDRRLEAEGASERVVARGTERATERVTGPAAARPARSGGRDAAQKRDAR